MRSAFELRFEQWPPPVVPLRHGHAAPIGAVRLAMSGKSRHREIKIRLDGPPGRRWMNLARFWWLRNRGPVPAGMRVGHFDGDTLNDDPSNYTLFSPGDVIASHHLDNPEWSQRQHRRCARATAESNRARAAAERARRWYPDRWYAVDLSARVIFNDPKRKRWMVYAAHGRGISATRNGRGYEAAVLGWPGLPRLSAAVLAVLANGEKTSLDLWLGVRELLELHRWEPPANRAALQQAMTPLFARGRIGSRRGRGGRARYHVTQAAVASRQTPVPVVARRGSELSAPEYSFFTRAVVAGSEAA